MLKKMKARADDIARLMYNTVILGKDDEYNRLHARLTEVKYWIKVVEGEI